MRVNWKLSGAGIAGALRKEEIVLSERVDAAELSASPAVATSTDETEFQSGALLSLILKSLDDDKAEDVVTIDLRGKSELADYMVIATGRSTRQVSAISDKLADRLKTELGVASRMEGKAQGDWVLIDSGDAVVHVFRPEVRDFYQLEKMWMPARPDSAASSGPS